MRTPLLILFLFRCFSPLQAQISLEEAYKGVTAGEYDAPERMHRWMIEVYHDRWDPSPASIETKWYSIGVSAARMIDVPLNKKVQLPLPSDQESDRTTFTTTDSSIMPSIV
jgi:hypothetical protein